MVVHQEEKQLQPRGIERRISFMTLNLDYLWVFQVVCTVKCAHPQAAEPSTDGKGQSVPHGSTGYLEYELLKSRSNLAGAFQDWGRLMIHEARHSLPAFFGFPGIKVVAEEDGYWESMQFKEEPRYSVIRT